MLSIACLLASPATAHETSNEVWPELDIFVKLGENSTPFLLSAGTRIREQGNSDGSLGVHLDLFTSPIFKIRLERTARRADIRSHQFLQIRIGYVYSRSAKSSSSQFSEHTPLLEISPRYYFPKQIMITNRAKGDLRFLNGIFTPRFRDRIKLERTFGIGKHAITPYGHAEAFYDWRYKVWHRFRYTSGAEWELSRHVVLEGYYTRQRDNRSSTKYLNAVGVAVQLYFH